MLISLLNLKKATGLTVVEVLLFFILLSFIFAVILPFIVPEEKHSIKMTLSPIEIKQHADILIISNALKLYKLDNGIYPTDAQGLEALVEKPKIPPIPGHWFQYLSDLPKDPWGESYYYSVNIEAQTFTLFDCGPPKAKQSFWQQVIFYLNSKNKACRNIN